LNPPNFYLTEAGQISIWDSLLDTLALSSFILFELLSILYTHLLNLDHPLHRPRRADAGIFGDVSGQTLFDGQFRHLNGKLCVVNCALSIVFRILFSGDEINIAVE